MTANETKDLVMRFVDEVLNGRKTELIDELFAPDYINHMIQPGQPQGREGERQLYAAFLEGFPDFRMEVDETIVEPDMLAGRWTFTGTNSGSFMGIPATGRKVSMTGINMFRVADGQIVENRSVFDQVGLMQQLGVIPGGDS